MLKKTCSNCKKLGWFWERRWESETSSLIGIQVTLTYCPECAPRFIVKAPKCYRCSSQLETIDISRSNAAVMGSLLPKLFKGVVCQQCKKVECTACKGEPMDAPCKSCQGNVSPAYEHLLSRRRDEAAEQMDDGESDEEQPSGSACDSQHTCEKCGRQFDWRPVCPFCNHGATQSGMTGTGKKPLPLQRGFRLQADIEQERLRRRQQKHQQKNAGRGQTSSNSQAPLAEPTQPRAQAEEAKKRTRADEEEASRQRLLEPHMPLIGELVSLLEKDAQDRRTQGGFGSSARIRQIGEELNREGGLDLMQAAYYTVRAKGVYFSTDIWDRIGRWLA